MSPKSPLLVERELEILLWQTKPRISVTLDLLVPRLTAVRGRLGDELAPPAGMSGLIVTGIQDSLPVPPYTSVQGAALTMPLPRAASPETPSRP